jgi:hypothetical protein
MRGYTPPPLRWLKRKLDLAYMGRLLQLTLLAANLVAALLDGSDSVQLGLPRLWTHISLNGPGSGRCSADQPAWTRPLCAHLGRSLTVVVSHKADVAFREAGGRVGWGADLALRPKAAEAGTSGGIRQ